MTNRNRRGRSPTRYAGATNANQNQRSEDYEPMDEDDQEELVESLAREAARQSLMFQNAYGYGIGGLAIVFSMVFPLLCGEECAADRWAACWSHSLFSAGVHFRSVQPFVWKSSTTRVQPRTRLYNSIDIVLQIVPIGLWWTGFLHDEEHFHLALLIGNLVTVLGARLIHWDMEVTERALEGLDAARYKHKCL